MDRIVAAKVFVTIAECGSLSGAAELLDMSRAMVTRYLAEMETWAGARLFHRTTRRINLTAAGDITLLRCQELLSLADKMPGVGDTGDEEPSGILRIACSQSLAQATVAAAIAAYLKRHRQAAVDLRIDNRAVNLVEERIDLAIRITNQLDPGVIARPLGICHSVVCAAPAYLREHGTPRQAADLVTHDCLTYTYFGKSLWHFEHAGATVSVPVSGSLSANESVVLLQAAVEGAGISLQPVFSAAPLIASGQLVALLPAYQPHSMGIHAIYMSRAHPRAISRTMLAFLAEWFAAHET